MTSSKQKVEELRKQDSHMSASEIARKIGVTHQRVSQILVELGLPTSFKKPAKHCICGKIIPNIQKYCQECFSKSKRIDLICYECGKIFQRRIREYVGRNLGQFTQSKDRYSGKVFCSRHCFGSYIGKNFGFTTHSKNLDERKTEHSKID